MSRTYRGWRHALLTAWLLALCSGFESLYLENRPEAVIRPTLWDPQIPGNCAARCVNANQFMDRIGNYSKVVVASVQLSRVAHPQLAHCGEPEEYGGDDGDAVACSPWDGAGLFLPTHGADNSGLDRFLLVSDEVPRPLFAGATLQDMTLEEEAEYGRDKDGYIGASPGLVAIREMCRMVHASSYASSAELLAGGEVAPRKQCVVSVGGFQDWTAIGSEQNAVRIAGLIAKLVRYTFADGVDLNLDHLGEISRFRAVAGGAAAGPDEYALFALLAKTLRAHLDELDGRIAENAKADLLWLDRAYQTAKTSPYYLLNKQHLETLVLERDGSDVSRRALVKRHARYEPPSRLQISWTTRLNAFVPGDHPVNYAHAMTKEEREVALDGWFDEPEAPEAGAEDEVAVLPTDERRPSALQSAGSLLRKIVNWFRPKPRGDGKRRLSAASPAVSDDDDDVFGVVHDESLEDNEGRRVWPLIRDVIDEVVVVAALRHITHPHPHSEYTSAAASGGHSEPEPEPDEDRHFIPDRHWPVLNITAIVDNFVNLGKVDPRKLRVLLEPVHLVPGVGLFDPKEFNEGINHVKRHMMVKNAAWAEDTHIPELLPKQQHDQRILHERLLKGTRDARSRHPRGYLALQQVRAYFSARHMGQRITPVFAFEWREVAQPGSAGEL